MTFPFVFLSRLIGLSKDTLVLSITPANPISSPLKDLRKVVPIRIVTEPHASQAEVDQLSDWWDGDVKMELPEI